MNASQVDNLLFAYTQLDRALLQREGEYTALLAVETRLKQEIESKKNEVQLQEKVTLVAQKLTELSRKDTLDKVAGIVTTALQDIKDPGLSFRINYKTERNQAVAEFMIYNSYLKSEMDILNSCGGTIADIVELPLKVSLLLKWRPQLAKILIMDEAFKHVSTADRPRLANFIKQLSEKLGLQIILISHSTELAAYAHKVFQVSHDGSKSVVATVKTND